MKTVRKVLIAICLLTISCILWSCAAQKGSVLPTVQSTGSEVITGSIQLRDVKLEKVNSKERVSISLSEVPPFKISRESDSSILVKMDNVAVPDSLRHKYGALHLKTIDSAFLYPKTIEERQWACLEISLKDMVPYRVHKTDSAILIDFDSLSSYAQPAQSQPVQRTRDIIGEYASEPDLKESASDLEQGDIKKYTGSKIASLDFQDASLKSVFRAISEVSGYNIVAEPAIQNTKISINMKDVPWDQALDTVLELNALGKEIQGTVIKVMEIETLKKAAEERQKVDIAEGKLRQISIEAKIVEINTNFTQELGVNWAGGFQTRWNNTEFGSLISNSSSGTVTSLPNGVGLTSSNVAVNFPTSAITAPTLGLVMGASKWVLDAQLSALEGTGDAKIISSPKVTTLDNEKATIRQGEQIPYITRDDDGTDVEFKDALLKLEVTPTITPDGRISMQVLASNDYADWTKKNVSGENPPINTNSVESKIVVNNGETIVIGGVYKSSTTNAVSGVPWLSNIPVLGWLFKTKSVEKIKNEVLVFITPRIM